MFNGLIRELATVQGYANNILNLKASYKPNLGDSIAVNGACLTVTQVFANGFAVELSKETRLKIATQNLRGRVHIEPALRYGDRIEGHLLQGHIDGVGEITSIKKSENGTDFFIKIPLNLKPFMASKGSVGVDGISLTINEVLENTIRLTLIPLTMRESLFGSYKVGRRVNIESDLLARYTASILENRAFLSLNSAQNNFETSLQGTNSSQNSKRELSWQDIERISYLY